MTSLYADPRLAVIYDALNPADHVDEFYLDLAQRQGGSVLDIGCGTGRLTVRFAESSFETCGVDPSRDMLATARQRPGGDKVTWLKASASQFAAGRRFDFALMTGHAFQTLLGDDEIQASLRNVGAHLSANGQFVFETRNPLAREWESWIPGNSEEVVNVPGLGVVHVHNDIALVAPGRVDYETHFRFADGETLTTTDALRFLGHAQVESAMRQAGFRTVNIMGDWDGSPFTASSREIIVIAGEFLPAANLGKP